MGMKLKSGADLCGFQLTNFCVQGEASAPSDAALGRKYFHTNATDDVATGISLLNRERIYLGEGAWRATAYLDDIAAINEKLNLITGDTDTDTLINNLKDLEEFLKDFSETDKLKSLLDGKLSTSGGTITSAITTVLTINTTYGALCQLLLQDRGANKARFGWGGDVSLSGYRYGAFLQNVASESSIGVKDDGTPYYNNNTLIHSGNSTSYNAGGLAHSNGTIGAVVNSSGNMTIGASDLALTNYRLYVNGKSIYRHAILADRYNGLDNIAGASIVINKGGDYFGIGPSASNKKFLSFGTTSNDSGDWKSEFMTIAEGGNVLIGATTDDNSGAKLQVNGLISCYSSSSGARHIFVGNTNGTVSLYVASSGNRGLFDVSNSKWMVYTDGTDIIMPRDVHIKGNLIVDGEVSAGGAGAEESTSGSGSAEGVSEIFTPTSTSMAFNHNLGEDVIVQVYEKSGNVWNMVIVDTEITSATKVTLRFGKTETTQHKVVIMGV